MPRKKNLLFSSILEKKYPCNIPPSLDNTDENESFLERRGRGVWIWNKQFEVGGTDIRDKQIILLFT